MKLTREGRRFLLAAILITAAAINTGNNLIYLILSLMLSFIILSYLILRINLSGIQIGLLIDGPVYAGEPFRAEILVKNNKKIPAYSLLVKTPESEACAKFGEIFGMDSAVESMAMSFSKRGRYGYSDFSIQSSFPFILFTKDLRVRLDKEIIVYPKLVDIGLMFPDIRGHDDRGMIAVRGRGDDLYSLRSFQEGDDWRRIHWKASARQSSLLVREYAEYASENVTILLDNHFPRDDKIFEKAVSIAASAAKYFVENGCMVRIVSGGIISPFGGGEEHLFNMLDSLAVIVEQEDEMVAPFDAGGLLIAVLKTENSAMAGSAALANRIIYADTL